MERFRRFLKVVAALSIPAGIAVFWWYSQIEANKEVDDYKKFQKLHPAQDKITVDNYELKEVDDTNTARFQLLAKHGTMEPVSKNVVLQYVTVSYFDPETKKVKLRLCAPAGLANEQTHFVKLNCDPKTRVTAEGQEGNASMEADSVELTKKNQFIASGGVNIVWPGVAKVSGGTATGSLEKSADLKNFKIVGNTHAQIGHI